MNPEDIHNTPHGAFMPLPTPPEAFSVAHLVGQVYEDAPPPERSHLLEQLLRPLGVLSLVAVADGIFAAVRFRSVRSGWNDIQVRAEDIQNVSAREVIELVNHVQQVSAEAVDGLAQIISTSPVLAGSAAAVVLAALLVKRARSKRLSEGDGG
jgi:hypothetical protein